MSELLTGCEAIARGAIKAGCDFVAVGPTAMMSSLDGLVDALEGDLKWLLPVEDETAAIGQCIGAAASGARAMTLSRGPGLRLCAENVGLALISEIPLVIVQDQTLGWATGLQSPAGDGDVTWARHLACGLPLPVLAPSDLTSAFLVTYEAFNIAERLRTPVLLLVSEPILLSSGKADVDHLSLSPRVERKTGDDGRAYLPYAVDAPERVPAFAPIGGARRMRVTGAHHNAEGLPTSDPALIESGIAHLRAKIECDRKLELTQADLDSGADCLLVSYGSADGATREAVDCIRGTGARVSRLTIHSLWPLPKRALAQALTRHVRRVIVPEINLGLYADELRKAIADPSIRIESIPQYDGGVIEPQTIVRKVLASLCG